MRVLVFYDLPMQEKEDVQAYNQFRKSLLKLGFYQVQFSIYAKVILNESGYDTFIRRIQNNIPPSGNIRILKVTEKQYDGMIFLRGKNNLHETVVGDKNIVVFKGEYDE